jgi:hypothetical protein
MGRQQAQQLDARVTGTTNDANFDHVLSFEIKLHADMRLQF